MLGFALLHTSEYQLRSLDLRSLNCFAYRPDLFSPIALCCAQNAFLHWLGFHLLTSESQFGTANFPAVIILCK